MDVDDMYKSFLFTFFLFLFLFNPLTLGIEVSPEGIVTIDFEEFVGDNNTTTPIIQDHYLDYGILFSANNWQPIDPPYDGPGVHFGSPSDLQPSFSNYLCSNWVPWSQNFGYCRNPYWVRFVEPNNPNKRVLVDNVSLRILGLRYFQGYRVYWHNTNGITISSQANVNHVPYTDDCSIDIENFDDTQDSEIFTAPGPVGGFYISNAGTYNEPCAGNGVDAFALDDVVFEPYIPIDPDDIKKDDKDCPAQDTGFGNPCDAATGNKYQRETDYAASNIGLSVVRHYSSQSNFDLGFGKGWSMPFYKRLVIGTKKVRIYKGNGSSEGFVKRNGSWIGSDEGILNFSEGSSSYTVTLPNGNTQLYSDTGLLISKTNKGKTTVYSYDINDQLSSVVGPFGHTLSFTYSNGHVQSITDPEGNTILYSYGTNNNLATVTYQDGSVRTYHYENLSFLNALTGITDERGIRFATFGYDNNGLAAFSQHAETSNGVPQENFSFTFDSSIQTTVTDPRGNVKTLTFEENLGNKNLLTSLNQTDGKSLNQQFDERNNVISKTDEEGRVTEYSYNSSNQLTQTRHAAQTAIEQVTNYTYQSSSIDLIRSIRNVSVASGQMHQTSFSYDSNFNLNLVTETGYDPAGIQTIKSTDYDFDNLGRMVRIDGPRTDVSDVTSTEYYTCTTGNECGQVKMTTNALGQNTTYDVYDNAGRIKKITNANGSIEDYIYDLRGRVTSISVSPAQDVLRTHLYVYGPSGRLINAVTPEGTSLDYIYDNAGYLESIADNLGNKISYTYDIAGNKLSETITDPLGILTKEQAFAYDIRNRVSAIVLGADTTQTVYDSTGNLIQTIDANLNSTTNQYDALNRVFESLDALGGVSQYQYNVKNQLTLNTTPNGATTQFSYDDFGNVLSEISNDRGTLNYSYNTTNNVTSIVDANGNTRNMSYDAIGRLTNITFPTDTSSDLTFAFDGNLPNQNGTGLLTQLSDANGNITYYHDGLGNITEDIRTINGNAFQIGYQYDANSRLTAITYPTGRIIEYDYDTVGNVLSVASKESITSASVNLLTNVKYQPFGPLTDGDFGNNQTINVGYDTAMRITDWDVNVNSNAVQSLDYNYDSAGNILGLLDNVVPVQSQTFTYDKLHRLDLAVSSYGNEDFSYDANGNRIQLTDSIESSSYDYSPNSNQLMSVNTSASTWNYIRDNNGSLVSKLDGSGEGLLYGYNQAGRLTSITNRIVIPPKGKGKPKTEDTLLATYTYNGLGQRASKIIGGDTIIYLYGLSGELIAEADAQGVIKVEYTYANGRLLAIYQQDGGTSEPPTELIIDDGDSGTSQTGSWTVKSSNKAHGNDYLLAQGNTESTYTWNITVPAGEYEVYGWWASTNKYNTQVPYTVNHSGTLSQVQADQTTNGQQWNLLGTYTFSATGNEYIQVSDANGKMIVDAIKLVSLPAPNLPQMKLYYVYNNELGTPKQMTDEDGQQVWSFNQTPFGVGTPNTDVDGDSIDVNLNVRFPGQYWDNESGLHYNYFRYYDPVIGRYLQSDPIGLEGGINTYAYVGGNPLSYVDPLGLAACSCTDQGEKVFSQTTAPISEAEARRINDSNSSAAGAAGWVYGIVGTLYFPANAVGKAFAITGATGLYALSERDSVQKGQYRTTEMWKTVDDKGFISKTTVFSSAGEILSSNTTSICSEM